MEGETHLFGKSFLFDYFSYFILLPRSTVEFTCLSDSFCETSVYYACGVIFQLFINLALDYY